MIGQMVFVVPIAGQERGVSLLWVSAGMRGDEVTGSGDQCVFFSFLSGSSLSLSFGFIKEYVY